MAKPVESRAPVDAEPDHTPARPKAIDLMTPEARTIFVQMLARIALARALDDLSKP